MIEREVIGNQLATPARDTQFIATLFHINGALANRATKSIFHLFPMEHLTGVQCLLEIEIRRRNFRQMHQQTSNV